MADYRVVFQQAHADVEYPPAEVTRQVGVLHSLIPRLSALNGACLDLQQRGQAVLSYAASLPRGMVDAAFQASQWGTSAGEHTSAENIKQTVDELQADVPSIQQYRSEIEGFLSTMAREGGAVHMPPQARAYAEALHRAEAGDEASYHHIPDPEAAGGDA